MTGRAATALALALCLATPATAEEFRAFVGHGGPVMDIAVDGDRVLTASFDNSVGLWHDDAEPVWLDGHEAAVNCVIPLPDSRVASGADDFDIIIWDAQGNEALRLEGHQGKVFSLAVSPDGARLASASWDGTVRIWHLGTGENVATLNEHKGPVNDVVWSRDGSRLYTAGGDGTVFEWNADDFTVLRNLARHGFGVNVLTLGPGWLAYGAIDGGTRVLDLETGNTLADLTAERRPILALAHSDDHLAVGDGEGFIMVVSTDRWRIEHDFRAALNGPIWALGFTPTGEGIIAGGIADEAMLWPLDGTDSAPRLAEIKRAFHVNPDEVGNGERQFLRKCSICHALGPDGERRAGPTLHGLFGREAGTVADYTYSDAVRDAELVWDDDTIDALFDIGPEHYIPGTKMPMQRIVKAEDRADLIEFLRRETKTE